MTIAGTSAGAEARRLRSRADEHRRQADEAEQQAGRYEIAGRTEAETARVLVPLAGIGYHLLADRRWPGSKRAQVDMIVVGSAGVFIIDTKAWREVSIHDDRIYRGQEDVTDNIARLADLVYGAEAALADISLPPGEIHAVVALAGQRRMHAHVASVDVIGVHDLVGHITKRNARLSAVRVNQVLAAVLARFPVIDGSQSPEQQLTGPEPVLPRQDLPLPVAIHDAELAEQLLDGVLEAPIEEWMAFLDPSQAKLVRRNFNGPARIRGAAGIDKTVVGIHRAAYLARASTGRVLFATYIGTLPKVLASLFERHGPELVDRVDFHQFATRLLKQRGIRFRVDEREARLAFDDAWNAIGAASPLRAARFTRRYWEDEIKHVIKGRGLTRFEQYADLARVGRKHGLHVEVRHAVWDLHAAYDRGLRKRGLTDWEDVVLLARDALRERPLAGYDAVIVDEAQDLSCAMVSLLHSLVRDRPDGLTLIGDGQQTIYPGGYTLGEVGVNLAGRGVVLEVNHRNTAEILDFAKQMVAADSFTDIEGVNGAGDAVPAVTRNGPAPVVHRAGGRADHDAAMLTRLAEVLRLVGTSHGDVGILTATNRQADDVIAVLRASGVPFVPLKDYGGKPVDAVKLGTVKRAKGVEFKQVLLTQVQGRLLADAPASISEAERERRELERRELYVGRRGRKTICGSVYDDGTFPVAATIIETLGHRVIEASSSAAEKCLTHGLFTAFRAVEFTDVPLEYESVKETGSTACAS
ncbi:UvrD-helicase domain-containing protein [Curtobacterium flaccumfaciens]|uniref:UvrD-helicase domain-containing protein n=1 Tax=Curtobacterium flaccumfaciens TaxID=2035 RepID=UPI0026598D22|nr:UvrD-helicase domain-containing protein [Curtobacterium flaccumfaciens]MCS5507215.1 AAA family ATPase [Curtobacterium flaccumfaciens pv. flaccumfaciens]